jgi:FKBP-type peptidyl-prolyl cis-trans isomerase
MLPLRLSGESMRFRWIALIGTLILTAQAGAQEGAGLKTEKAKVSYGIGVGMAKNLQRQGIEVETDSLLQGLQDALSGTKLLMTEEELQKTMTSFQNAMLEKQAQALKLARGKNKNEGDAFLAENSKKEGVVSLPSGLQYKILKMGDGKMPKDTDIVECHYRGTLVDGTEFDSSYARKQPATFKVKGGVIPGWTEALLLMPVGSKFQFFIPPQLAYGENGAGGQVGPNATLIFEVELLAIK